MSLNVAGIFNSRQARKFYSMVSKYVKKLHNIYDRTDDAAICNLWFHLAIFIPFIFPLLFTVPDDDRCFIMN